MKKYQSKSAEIQMQQINQDKCQYEPEIFLKYFQVQCRPQIIFKSNTGHKLFSRLIQAVKFSKQLQSM